MSLSRGVIDALLPGGSLWVPEDDQGFDLLLAGVADNTEVLRLALADLATVRDPLRTSWLSDLEREFGIIPDPVLTEGVRRQRLLATKTAGNSDGSLDFMQDALQAAGFDINVYANSPAVDPALLLAFGSSSIFGNADAMFGKEGAMFAGSRGYLLVNGPLYHAGAPVEYVAPTDPIYWPLVFFIGGAVTRDGSGAITQLSVAEIPNSRRNELVRLIVKYKPMHTWCGLVVRYI